MKIRVYSDLHLESVIFVPPRDPCDVVILAGDIHEGIAGVLWARETFPDIPVIYVAGNHEYYGQTMPDLAGELKQACRSSGVHFLDRDVHHIGPVRFLGCTLWTSFELLDDRAASLRFAEQRMTDYRRIRIGPTRRLFRPADAVRAHEEALDWLGERLEEPHPGPTVVVTHHAPTARSLPRHRVGGDRSPAYASNLEDLLERGGPDLWIHGHVHERCDYLVGATRVVCNPRGTGSDSIAEFDATFTLDLEEV